MLSVLDAALAEGSTGGREAALQQAMQILADHLPHYRWVGVYLLDQGVLNLGAYVGASTPHTLIPLGQGVCGTAVATGQNQVIADVNALTNYLACSVDCRSEIVVLIRDVASNQIVGQIDADGVGVGDFDGSDERLLEQVAARLAPRMYE